MYIFVCSACKRGSSMLEAWWVAMRAATQVSRRHRNLRSDSTMCADPGVEGDERSHRQDTFRARCWIPVSDSLDAGQCLGAHTSTNGSTRRQRNQPQQRQAIRQDIARLHFTSTLNTPSTHPSCHRSGTTSDARAITHPTNMYFRVLNDRASIYDSSVGTCTARLARPAHQSMQR